MVRPRWVISRTVFRGMKGYNGVAILSRYPVRRIDVAPDWCAKGDCRHIAVELDLKTGPVELHDFYVPAGGDDCRTAR